MTFVITEFTIASTTKKYAANRNTAAITTPVVARTDFQLGHVTRFISVRRSSMYDRVFCGQLTALLNSILIHPMKRRILAGAEGFEPPKAVLETAGLPLAYAPRWDLYFVSRCG